MVKFLMMFVSGTQFVNIFVCSNYAYIAKNSYLSKHKKVEEDVA